MRSRQVSPAQSAFEPRIGPRVSPTSHVRAASHPAPGREDLSQLNVALAAIANATIAHVLASREVRAEIFGEIRAIIRQEISQAPFADRLLDASEAAERIGITEAALRKAAARGTVPCKRIGRRLRFRLSELMVRVEACRTRQRKVESDGAATSSTLP
jgi:hypothetical protein